MIRESFHAVVDIPNNWLRSGLTARITGLELSPVAHPAMPDIVQRIVKGQATVYFLRQHPQGHIWLLKEFIPSRRPSVAYLLAVHHCLPGGIAFFTCTQRRLIAARHLDRRYSAYKPAEFMAWLEGTILMPKVPGCPWSSVADDLRTGGATMTLRERLTAAVSLAECVEHLEIGECCHRDLSAFNVFLAPDGRVFLIDWDSLYHATLPFQANTTVGTMGYLAPFIRTESGEWDAARSWRPCADRYALGILIAEFLCCGPRQTAAQEDGTMFAQSQLDDPACDFVREQNEALLRLDKRVGCLFWKTMHARSFDTCPPPGRWRAVLQNILQSGTTPAHNGTVPSPRIKVACTNCGTSVWTTSTWFAEIQNRGLPFLCRACRQARARETAARRHEREQTLATVTCEHCGALIRIGRNKLDDLRAKGNPILCPGCLPEQLARWKKEQSEWTRDHPEATCSQCGTTFRLRREKLAALTAIEKPLLCWECLKPQLSTIAHIGQGTCQ